MAVRVDADRIIGRQNQSLRSGSELRPVYDPPVQQLDDCVVGIRLRLLFDFKD